MPAKLRAQDDLQWILRKLPESINSSYEESKPVTTNTGDSLFFVRSFHPANKGGELAEQDIWLTIRDSENHWSQAENELSGINNSMPNMVVGIAAGNKGLYHLNYLIQGDRRSVSVFYSTFQNGRFASSERIEIDPIRVGWDYHDVYMHPGGDVLLISMNALSSIGKEDLFVCYLTDENIWSGPLHMGPVLNTRGFEISPFLSHDKKMIYFSSDGFDGSGDADIFRSERIGDSWQNWSPPENLGKPFNSEKFDAYYFQNENGEIFLASNRGAVYADLYQVMAVRTDKPAIAGKGTPSNNKSLEQSVNEFPSAQSGNLKDSVALVVAFQHDRFKLDVQELNKLDSFLAGLSLTENDAIRVVGYTDGSGSELYNKKLSYKRADHVARQIRKMGVDKDRVEIMGMGIYRKWDAAKLEPGQKRRVELIILSVVH